MICFIETYVWTAGLLLATPSPSNQVATNKRERERFVIVVSYDALKYTILFRTGEKTMLEISRERTRTFPMFFKSWLNLQSFGHAAGTVP